jgi:hypothetical protein
VHHQIVRWGNGATINFTNGRLHNSLTIRSQSQSAKSKRTRQRTATVNSSKPQQSADMARTGQWTVPCLMHHRTAWCTHRQQSQPTARKWLEAINTPQPPPFKSSKLLTLLIQYKSKEYTPKTQSRHSILSKLQNQIKCLVTWERVFCISFVALVAWIAFFFSL